MKGAWRRGLFRISPGGTLRVTLAMPLCLDLVGGLSFRFFESDKILRCNETSFRYILQHALEDVARHVEQILAITDPLIRHLMELDDPDVIEGLRTLTTADASSWLANE
jgi:hypothetical protein